MRGASECQMAGKDLGGRRERFTNSTLDNARQLADSGQSAPQLARDRGMSRATLYRRISGNEAQHPRLVLVECRS